MAFIDERTKKRIDTIVRDVRDYASLVDDPGKPGSVPGLPCAPGLGMHTEAESFRALSKDIQDGVFKTLVMGKFKNGKSTFINALVGRVMMAARAAACTAVIATVEFGHNTDEVRVVYTDKPPVKMSLQRFTEEFTLSEADQKLVEDGGRLDRFANVSHVEMQSDDSLFADGMRLIDSPGLEEDISRTLTTNKFVPKANAIIFTMSATSLFSAKEREYIAENFAGKGLRNVFFVVNRIDNLTEGQLEDSVMPSVRAGLAEVFTDARGRFDEELYRRRVFFTNAYGALCARTGEPYKLVFGKKEVEVPMELADTGMLEFERALQDFLNSDERIHATFSSTLTGMANTYQSAEKRVAADKAVRAQSKEQREHNAALAQEKLDEAQRQVEEIRKTVQDCGTNVAQKVYNDLISFVQTDIPREFAAYAKTKDAQNKFGMGAMMKLAAAVASSKLPLKSWQQRAERDIRATLDPLTNRVNAYIKEQMKTWAKRVPTLIGSDIRDLEAELNEQCTDFDLSLDEAVNLFAYGNARSPVIHGSAAKAGMQSVIAMMNLDVSLMMEANAQGGMGWIEFAKRAAIQIALDMAVGLVFGGGLLLPVALFVEILSMKYRAGEMESNMLTNIGNAAFEGLGQKIRDNEVTFKENVIREFTLKGEAVAATARGMVADAKKNIAKLLSENAGDQAAADAENRRVDTVLRAMHQRIDSVYNALYGRDPTESEFLNLAKNTKK